jgi:hypothetical protein
MAMILLAIRPSIAPETSRAVLEVHQPASLEEGARSPWPSEAKRPPVCPILQGKDELSVGVKDPDRSSDSG